MTKLFLAAGVAALAIAAPAPPSAVVMAEQGSIAKPNAGRQVARRQADRRAG